MAIDDQDIRPNDPGFQTIQIREMLRRNYTANWITNNFTHRKTNITNSTKNQENMNIINVTKNGDEQKFAVSAPCHPCRSFEVKSAKRERIHR